jgi:hypothetical protein
MLNGAQAGPVTTDELTVLFTAGTLRGDTLVWRQGMGSWLPASQVPELASALASVPAAAVPVVATPITATGPVVVTSAPAAAPLTGEAADIEQNKVFGVISYLGLLFLVPLIAAKQSKFAMYHCNQGAVLFVIWICTMIALWIVGMIFHLIPFLGFIIGILLLFLHFALWVGFLALMIVGIINAINGKMKPLPLIGSLFTLVK